MGLLIGIPAQGAPGPEGAASITHDKDRCHLSVWEEDVAFYYQQISRWELSSGAARET